MIHNATSLATFSKIRLKSKLSFYNVPLRSCKWIIPVTVLWWALFGALVIFSKSSPSTYTRELEKNNNNKKQLQIWHPAWHSLFAISMAAMLFGFIPNWDNYPAFEREVRNKAAQTKEKGPCSEQLPLPKNIHNMQKWPLHSQSKTWA